MNWCFRGQNICLRPMREEDLRIVYHYNYELTDPEWKRWDAPYYHTAPLVIMDFEEFEKQREDLIHQNNEELPETLGIEHQGDYIGMVTVHDVDKTRIWKEIGIVIYDPKYWGRGYGSEALKVWINLLFKYRSIHRLGLATWSGNERMIRAIQSLGWIEEARIRRARVVNGVYYDSLRFGILREEWELTTES